MSIGIHRFCIFQIIKMFKLRFIKSILFVSAVLAHRVVDSFCPGDVDSLAAAVAASHIGKPPLINKSPINQKALKNGAVARNTPFVSNYHVIGKAPEHLKKIMVDKATVRITVDQVPIHQGSTPSIQSTEIPNDYQTLHLDRYELTLTQLRAIGFAHAVDYDKRFEVIFVTENDSSDASALENNKSKDCVDDADDDDVDADDVPYVHAIFCGYRATPEEVSRLRSANVCI
jgi:hypothetical protein